jgi:bifunctional non-homologous end joining protein LigD
MKHLRWVKPEVVVRIAFTEWTRHGHLRHASFEGVRSDKVARDVVREGAAFSDGRARANAKRAPKRRTSRGRRR